MGWGFLTSAACESPNAQDSRIYRICHKKRVCLKIRIEDRLLWVKKHRRPKFSCAVPKGGRQLRHGWQSPVPSRQPYEPVQP